MAVFTQEQIYLFNKELKHCPYCGGNAEIETGYLGRGYFIKCKKCGCDANDLYKDIYELINFWNTRKAIDPKKAGHNIVFKCCPFCGNEGKNGTILTYRTISGGETMVWKVAYEGKK